MIRSLALALCLLQVLLIAADCGTRHVIVYGDSLIREAAPTIKQRLTDDPVWYGEVKQYPGGSLCNYLPAFLADIQTGLALVVVETAGNSLTPCSGAWPLGSEEYFAQFETDLETFFATAQAHGTPLVFVEPPPVGSFMAPHNANLDEIIRIARSLAVAYPVVSITPAPRQSVSLLGAYTQSLPCLIGETAETGCVNGTILIREPLGLHFCPVGVSTVPCPGYSSGALRFGKHVANAIMATP